MLIKNLNTKVTIAGRYTVKNEIVYLAGSASYIEFKTCASHISVNMTSDVFFAEKTLRAYAAVFLNEEEIPSLRFPLEKGEHSYQIFSSDIRQEVSIRIMKYSEQAFASMGIVSIESDGMIFPLKKKSDLKIEFVGDSITCGYGIEGIVEKDVFDTAQENPWEAYACRTARILHADFEMLCWSGNGMISHYIAPEVNERRTEKPLIPEMYPYSDRELEERMGYKELTLWNPASEPDIIVINVGTNDSSYTRNLSERNAFFSETYRSFLKMVRDKHPAAKIICLIGTMEQCVHQEIQTVVSNCNADGDQNIFYLKAPLQDPADGLATDYHPSPITHQKAAKLLAEFIQKFSS